MGLLHVICLSLVFVGYTQAYKECYTQEIYGARYHEDVNGLYDVTDELRCNGRSVWKKRDMAEGETQRYIYYFRRSLMRRGWIVGTNPCSSERQYGVAYVWNTNRRPDRGLLGWLEYDQTDLRWRLNGGFEVRCTEGLSYGAIVGIVIGCIAGVCLIIGGIGFFCRYRKRS